MDFKYHITAPAVARLIAVLCFLAVVANPPARAGAARASVADRIDCPLARQLAAGVFVVDGAGGTPNRHNRGRVGNTVILVGATGLVIVDPGPTLRSGRAVACSARRLSRRPVAALINTHPHPENVLANIAFAGVPIYAAAGAAEAMRDRCGRCQQALAGALGKKMMAGTRAALPTVSVETTSSATPGGRSIHLIPLGNAHSPGDLAIIDAATGTLIGGDVVTVSELPDLRDGSTRGWIAALERLQAMDSRLVIPGRGRAFDPTNLAKPLSYLKQLMTAAELAAEAGAWPPQINGESDYANEFSRAAELHPMNLQHAYREAENDWWARPPGSKATR